MTRLLVVGVGPRPAAGQSQVFAPGLRLHTMTAVALAAGHEVHVLEALFPGVAAEVEPPAGVASHEVVPLDVAALTRLIDAAAERLNPDALVVLTDGVALAAARCRWRGPLYVDYNGHPMAERQMQGAVHENDDALAAQWAYVLPVLLRADRFATCSRAQRLALIGELGAAGRINARTCGHELVDVLRPPLPFEHEFTPTHPGLLRGGHAAHDARIILFTGGYNTWLDEELLFEAVERALGNDPRALYVSTGGEIHGHVSRVFQRFRARVEASPHRERYRFLGWLDHTDYVDCCLEADVGIMTDRWTLEGELGCRNRLYGWLWGGMRAVATNLAEIVHAELGPAGLVAGTPTGDVEALAAALTRELALGRFDAAAAAERRQLLRRLCAPSIYYGDFVRWIAAPGPAPDRSASHLPRNPLAEWMAQVDAWGNPADPQSLAADISRTLDRLAGSRAFRLYLAAHPETAALFERVRARMPAAPP
jgi:hypothetical protein